MKTIFEPVTKSIKDLSEVVAKTTTENSFHNNKARENLNKKTLELMNDKAMIAPQLTSSLVILCKPKNKSHFRIKKNIIQLR